MVWDLPAIKHKKCSFCHFPAGFAQLPSSLAHTSGTITAQHVERVATSDVHPKHHGIGNNIKSQNHPIHALWNYAQLGQLPRKRYLQSTIYTVRSNPHHNVQLMPSHRRMQSSKDVFLACHYTFPVRMNISSPCHDHAER